MCTKSARCHVASTGCPRAAHSNCCTPAFDPRCPRSCQRRSLMLRVHEHLNRPLWRREAKSTTASSGSAFAALVCWLLVSLHFGRVVVVHESTCGTETRKLNKRTPRAFNEVPSVHQGRYQPSCMKCNCCSCHPRSDFLELLGGMSVAFELDVAAVLLSLRSSADTVSKARYCALMKLEAAVYLRT